MLGSGWGELGGGKSLVARECMVAAGSESSSLCSAVLFCVFSLSVLLLLLLFPLFAVLLNCPYPDPPVSACFFLFSSAPQQGEGRPRGAFVAGCRQTTTYLITQTQLQIFPLSRMHRSDCLPPFSPLTQIVALSISPQRQMVYFWS